ncbi:MAG: hypothetical protein D6705_13025 [Deltaproteobacteria bacterium]|nr:MAG: hypothetical protein D6705_13025 [Deltaproteobacteria bacterium]
MRAIAATVGVCALRATRRLETAGMVAGLAVGVVAVAAAYRGYLSADEPIPGLRVDGVDASLPVDVLTASVADQPLEVSAGTRRETVSLRDVGARVDPEAIRRIQARIGRTGDPLADLAIRAAASRGEVSVPLPLQLDLEVALAWGRGLADRVARPGRPARLDLDGRRVLPAEPGVALVPADVLGPLSTALARGARRVEVPVIERPPPEGSEATDLEGLDVSVLLASFETHYSMAPADRDRAHNLEVGAVAVDGFVLRPGETFSFNEVVGPRTAENGYRYAPGITAGELVDVLGGGICQVSSTLFGAAFFAGLEIERARPHSRPSSYVDMGLDSTVVYPDVDLRLRNGFDFPVVFHMKVADGTVRAEILGPERPYRIAFERELVEELPYERRVRDDESLATGAEVVVQRGRRGYRLVRRRIFLDGDREVRRETTNLFYPPTTEIVRRGTSPDGARPKPRSFPPLRTPQAHLRIVQ